MQQLPLTFDMLLLAEVAPRGWSSAELWGTARLAFFVFVLPPLAFATCLVAFERRLGRASLGYSWLLATCGVPALLAFRALTSAIIRARLERVGGMIPVLAFATSFYAICFGASTLAAVIMNARSRPRSRPLRYSVALGSAILAIPVAIALGVATESFWGGP